MFMCKFVHVRIRFNLTVNPNHPNSLIIYITVCSNCVGVGREDLLAIEAECSATLGNIEVVG